MRYGNMTIGSTDQYYLDELADKYDIDYYDCDIYINEDTSTGDITNQLFYYVLSEAVNNLDISDNNKEQLQERIYCNCFDSGFDISSNDVDEIIEGTDEEKEIIKKFLYL